MTQYVTKKELAKQDKEQKLWMIGLGITILILYTLNWVAML